MPIAPRTWIPLAVLALLALADPLPAAAGRTIKLKFPRFDVPARSDREVCTFVRLPLKRPYDASGTLIVNIGGAESFTSHHLLAYAYTGNDMEGFPADGVVVESSACLDFGPADRNSRVLLATSQTPKRLDRLPRGLAQRITPTVAGDGRSTLGIVLNSHWINGSDRSRSASVKVKLLPAKRGTVRRYLKPIFEPVACGLIAVPPGEERTVGFSWAPGRPDLGALFFGGAPPPPGPACVEQITSHTHKRGKRFTIELVRAGGQRTKLLENLDYSDPPQATFDGQHGNPAPIFVTPKDRLEYACVHDNGMTNAPRLGCEEVPGEAPGQAVIARFPATDGAAKRCAQEGPAPAECPGTDPAFPGRSFTGNCVKANLVFGFTSDDEMCIMPGAYFDANPDAPPGRECDLTLLPVVS
jgi:hypothetical protein